MANEMQKTTPFGMRDKVGYMFGDFANDFTFILSSSFLMKFYTDVMGVSAGVVGMIMMIARFVDAFTDVTMGQIVDRSKPTKDGKFRPWLLRSAPCVAITFIIFFTVPTYFKGVTMLVVLFFCKILYEGFYTMFNIPMGSMLSAMADTDGERAALSSARGFGSMIGNIIPMIIMPQLLAKFGDGLMKMQIVNIQFGGRQ